MQVTSTSITNQNTEVKFEIVDVCGKLYTKLINLEYGIEILCPFISKTCGEDLLNAFRAVLVSRLKQNEKE